MQQARPGGVIGPSMGSRNLTSHSGQLGPNRGRPAAPERFLGPDIHSSRPTPLSARQPSNTQASLAATI